MPRINGSLLTYDDFAAANAETRVTLNTSYPSDNKILDANECRNLAFLDAPAGDTRCPSYEEIIATSDPWPFRYSASSLANAQIGSATTVYICTFYSPSVGYYFYAQPNTWLATGAANGWYVMSGSGSANGTYYQLTSGNGRIDSVGSITNTTLVFEVYGIVGGSASTTFGGLWSTGVKAAGSGPFTNTVTTAAGGSYSIAVVRSGSGSAGTITMYKNGVQVQSKSAPINVTTTFNSTVVISKGDHIRVTVS